MMRQTATAILPRDALAKSTLHVEGLDFSLPPELEASEPPEARGLARDAVRLMVSYLSDSHIVHAQFHDLDRFLRAGDALVINTSGTMNAALKATRADGMALELHLSTRFPADLWIVEVREPDGTSTKPFCAASAGETLALPGGGSARLLAPCSNEERSASIHNRLWIAALHLPLPLNDYLEAYGFPIRYSYVRQGWPSSYYQNVYATEIGSAEMPSAGRAFTYGCRESGRS
jgi:S-adenosylmethionine:tRNA ribosyltransferase-isomerase